MTLLVTPWRTYPQNLIIYVDGEHKIVAIVSEQDQARRAGFAVCTSRAVPLAELLAGSPSFELLKSLALHLSALGLLRLSLFQISAETVQFLSHYIAVEDFCERAATSAAQRLLEHFPGSERQLALQVLIVFDCSVFSVLDVETGVVLDVRTYDSTETEVRVAICSIKSFFAQRQAGGVKIYTPPALFILYFSDDARLLAERFQRSASSFCSCEVLCETFLAQNEPLARTKQQLGVLVNGAPVSGREFSVSPTDIVGFRSHGAFYQFANINSNQLQKLPDGDFKDAPDGRFTYQYVQGAWRLKNGAPVALKIVQSSPASVRRSTSNLQFRPQSNAVQFVVEHATELCHREGQIDESMRNALCGAKVCVCERLLVFEQPAFSDNAIGVSEHYALLCGSFGGDFSKLEDKCGDIADFKPLLGAPDRPDSLFFGLEVFQQSPAVRDAVARALTGISLVCCSVCAADGLLPDEARQVGAMGVAGEATMTAIRTCGSVFLHGLYRTFVGGLQLHAHQLAFPLVAQSKKSQFSPCNSANQPLDNAILAELCASVQKCVRRGLSFGNLSADTLQRTAEGVSLNQHRLRPGSARELLSALCNVCEASFAADASYESCWRLRTAQNAPSAGITFAKAPLRSVGSNIQFEGKPRESLESHLQSPTSSRYCAHSIAILPPRQFFQRQLVLAIKQCLHAGTSGDAHGFIYALHLNPFFMSSVERALVLERLQQALPPEVADSYAEKAPEVCAGAVALSGAFEASTQKGSFALLCGSRYSVLLRYFRNLVAHCALDCSYRFEGREIKLPGAGALFDFFQARVAGFFQVAWEAWQGWLQSEE